MKIEVKPGIPAQDLETRLVDLLFHSIETGMIPAGLGRESIY